MPGDANLSRSEILALTAEIVMSYAGNNSVKVAGVPGLIETVFIKLNDLSVEQEPIPDALIPAVPIKRSVTDDFIICLEDGRKLKMLKRHLMTAYGLTPEAYRAKWGLKPGYPMVAPNYSARRKELAKSIGLGRKPELRKLELQEPEPETVPVPAKRRARKAVAA